MTQLHEIILFIENKVGVDDIKPDTDIFKDLGCCGDDFDELMEEYFRQFNVKPESYLWYFHADEEGQSFGANFFKPLYERVKRIPITPALLLDFANKGFWDIKYPEHKLPKYRFDIWLNWLLVVVGLFFIIKSCKN